MTPSVVGISASAADPPAPSTSADVIGTSLAPKSTVLAWNCLIPAPEPTAW